MYPYSYSCTVHLYCTRCDKVTDYQHDLSLASAGHKQNISGAVFATTENCCTDTIYTLLLTNPNPPTLFSLTYLTLPTLSRVLFVVYARKYYTVHRSIGYDDGVLEEFILSKAATVH